MDRVGKYQLIRKLATGGMAEVFLARAEGPGGFSKKLVVKRILPHFVSDPTFAAMFLSEARLAAELNHPNVVQIFDFGQADGQYYLAMEFIDGANLRVLNAAAIAQGVRIPFPLAARMVSHAAEGLHFAHELCDEEGKHIGLIHRDISPDNILVSRNGAVKVVDFGIAKASAQPSMTRSGVIKGKMAYMPPEQLGRKPLDRRIDIFALGVVLHELVTGTWPFDASSEVSIIQAIMNEVPFTRVRVRQSEVPEALDAIVARCLEKNREARFATARELQTELEKYIASTGQAVQASELADLVTRLVPTEPRTDAAHPAEQSSPDLDHTFRREVTEGDPLASTSIAQGQPVARVQKSEPQLAAVKKSAMPMVAAGIGFVAVLAVMAAWMFRQPPMVAIDLPVAAVPVDAGLIEHDSGTALVLAAAVIDAGLEAVATDSGTAAAEPDPVPVPVDAKVPVAAKAVKVEFRIRPFARVFVDGKELGETPFPAVAVPVGKHKVRLVNASLNKDVEVEHQFRPGENVFKYNLKE
jgi:serine/threonine protein kinase